MSITSAAETIGGFAGLLPTFDTLFGKGSAGDNLPAPVKAKAPPPEKGGDITVRGDPELIFSTGERIHYYGPALFVLLNRDGIKNLVYVDVYDGARGDNISDVWARSFSGPEGSWVHRHIEESDHVTAVPVNDSLLPTTPSGPPSDETKFNNAVTWFVFEGTAIPGPSATEIRNALSKTKTELFSQITINDVEQEKKANILGYNMLLGYFRQNQFVANSEIRQRSLVLLGHWLGVHHRSR